MVPSRIPAPFLNGARGDAMAFLTFIILFLPTGTRSQPLKTTICLPDWGVRSISELRFGEVSLFGMRDSLMVGRLSVHRPGSPEYSGESAVPVETGGFALVADLSGEDVNSLGGSFNVYYRPPAKTSVSYVLSDSFMTCLRLRYRSTREGFCGLWVELFDRTRPRSDRVLCDVRSFAYVSLWIRGERGGEQISLRVADDRLERAEDSMPLGQIGKYTTAGHVTRDWQRADIPLALLPSTVDAQRLALLIIQPDGADTSSVDIRSIKFLSDPPAGGALPQAAPALKPTGALEKALWVWETDSLIESHSRAQEFLSYCTGNRIDRVFLAIPYRAGQYTSASSITIPQESIRRLLGDLSRAGIRADALFGDVHFVFPGVRPFLLNSVRNVLEYNGAVHPDERFEGIHLDVEPYLLPGFMGARQSMLLDEYFNLIGDTGELIKDSGLRLTVDIPFWYDVPDEVTGELGYGDKAPPVLHRILDLVDEIVVMDYRTIVLGSDGIVHQARGELDLATQKGKNVLIGLESGSLPREEIYTLNGEPVRVDATTSSTLVAFITRDDSVDCYFLDGLSDLEALHRAGPVGDSVFVWEATLRAIVPPEKLTFAPLGRSALIEAMEEAAPLFARYPSFQGFALHHYGSLRQLRNGDVAP